MMAAIGRHDVLSTLLQAHSMFRSFSTPRFGMFKPLVVFGLMVGLSVTAVAGNHSSKLKKNRPADAVVTAARAGGFDTLIRLLAAAELLDAVRDAKTITIFAPTDEAFGKLPPEAVADLLKPENVEQLQSILKLHVLTKTLRLKDSGDASAGEYQTLAGQKITVARLDDRVSVRVNDSKVVAQNIAFDNGLIHVIDTVLMPTGDDDFKGDAKGTLVLKTDRANYPIEQSGLQKEVVVIEVNGTGVVKLSDIRAGTVRVKAADAGRVELSGSANRVELDIAGAARVVADQLEAGNVAADVRGAAQSFVRADAIDAKIAGVGRVTYYGDAKVTKDVSGYGRIEPAASDDH